MTYDRKLANLFLTVKYGFVMDYVRTRAYVRTYVLRQLEDDLHQHGDVLQILCYIDRCVIAI